MNMEIFHRKLGFDLHGFSGTAIGRDYAGIAFKLMDKMWQLVKANNLRNKGLNIWVYEPEEKVFAGVELYDTPGEEVRLEHKNISLVKYAYFKHVGPYKLIKEAGQNMINEIKKRGFEMDAPYVEVYGHWNNDETKLETELYISLK